MRARWDYSGNKKAGLVFILRVGSNEYRLWFMFKRDKRIFPSFFEFQKRYPEYWTGGIHNPVLHCKDTFNFPKRRRLNV